MYHVRKSKYSAGGETPVDLRFLETGSKILQMFPCCKNASVQKQLYKNIVSLNFCLFEVVHSAQTSVISV